MTDTDPHQRPSKNGKDRQQDRELRELREDNHEQHRDITALIASLQGDVKAGALVGRVLWLLAFVFLSTLSGVIGWMANRIDDLRDEIDEVEHIAVEHEKEGMEIGRGLRRDVDSNEQDIKELRRRLRMKD
jgi:hypothetical protein